MKHPRLAISAMAAVQLLLFFLLLLPTGAVKDPEWIADARLAIVPSQAFLLGVWIAFGGKPIPWRAIAVITVIAAWDWYIGKSSGPIGSLNAVLAGETSLAMGILLFARFMGLRLSNAKRGDAVNLGHAQFSIGQALMWMTGLAVFMGVAHYLKGSFAICFNNREICWPVSWLALGLSTLWLVCGSRWIAIRCSLPLLFIGLGTAWIVRVNQWWSLPINPWLMPWWCVKVLFGYATSTAASLAVVRLAGYRLTWHWPFRRRKP
jgi:hypothetical protein